MSVTQVWERLFIGGIEDTESNPFPVTTVVSLCRGIPRKRFGGVNYLHYPVEGVREIRAGLFDAFIDALWENIRWGTVLIHCRAGSNRAPVLAAAWMHAAGYKNVDAALTEVGLVRSIKPNPALLRSVKTLL